MNTQDNRPTGHPDADGSADNAKQQQASDRDASIPDGSDDETEFCPIQPEYPKYPRPSNPFELPQISPGIYGNPFAGANAPLHAPKAKLRRAVIILAVLLICGGIAEGVPCLSGSESTKPAPEEKTPAPSSTEMGAQLLAAAAAGKEAEVRRLAEAGADLNVTDSDRNTPLHLAVKRGHVAVARLLLEKGAKSNTYDRDGVTPLFTAVAVGNEAMVRLLIEQAEDIDETDMQGSSLLHVAVRKGYKEIVKLLLSRGASTNLCDDCGRKPAELASDDETKKILMQFLLSHKDSEGSSTVTENIQAAIEEGNEPLVKFLIEECDADPNMTIDHCRPIRGKWVE